MGRPSNKTERRGQISDALMRVMAKTGYAGASVATVAREAGLTPGLVHYHFKSKLEILLHMLEGILQDHHGRLSAAIERAGDAPRAQLMAYLDVHLATGASADPDAMASWVMLGAEAIRNEEVRGAYAAALRRGAVVLREIIEAGVRSGDFVCADPQSAAAALTALIQGYFDLAVTARDLIPRGSASAAAKSASAGLLGLPEH